ncbi:hypothetical protein HK103_003030 [Boothiomyces macroporosus]|uniref:HMG box domain-containing protein n=1 Tax=Boothiomyces macroporosus TaxID=261099 RepID=A0AAD5UCN2_9FUNG|nr:hypothetical protein HK103_003030 [Boothiomyces macroporosus]
MSLKKIQTKENLPLNGFFLYKKQHYQKIKEEFNLSKSNQVTAIAAKRWALEPKSVKDQYRVKAKEQFKIYKQTRQTEVQKLTDLSKLIPEPLHEDKDFIRLEQELFSEMHLIL